MRDFLGRLSEKFRGAKPSATAQPAAAPASAPKQYVESALVHHGAGRLAEAESLYRKALAVDAGHFDALHMLGVVHHQTGQSAKAVDLIEQAISVVPENYFAYGNLGLAYLALNRLDKAEASLRMAVALRSDWDSAHNSLGTVLRAAGRMDDAEACFRRTVQLNPANSDAVINLGKICRERGKLDEAIDCFRKALALRPRDASPLIEIGSIHAASAELAEAEATYRAALQIDGRRFDATCNLADVLRRLGRLNEAESFARTALALRPDDPDALNTLACVLLRNSALDEAEACCRKALSIRNDDAPTRTTLGTILNARGRQADAEACFRAAIRLQPDAASARYNLAMLTLLRGEYREGLALYESRFDVLRGDFGISPVIRALLQDERRWAGEALCGRRLLVWAEQGFGDTLMMLRYLPLLKARGAGAVIVLCEHALGRLVHSISASTIGVSSAQTVSADAFDVHCPIMSLPFLFDTTPDTIPDRVPYIAAPEEMVDAWKARLSPTTKPRVGLAWAGARTLRDDARRSIPLAAFEAVIKSSSVQLVSLQKDDGAGELAKFRGQIQDWMGHCDDFLDTAALVSNLDLVIAVDSAVAHLAGALGRPVWLLNRRGSEWRWGLESDRSPWYPSMRIFRQQETSGWDRVIVQVADELGKL